MDIALILDSKSLLLGIPPELQSMIAGKLDPVSFCNLKLVCKGFDMWTNDPPKLSASEWLQYHSPLETSSRRRGTLNILGCSSCGKFLDKGLFSNNAARKTLLKGRLCISCAIQNGSHDKRDFLVGVKDVFGCRGCQKAKALDEEDKCWVDNERWFEHLPKNDIGGFVASRGCRWCHDCWTVIMNYRSVDKSPY